MVSAAHELADFFGVNERAPKKRTRFDGKRLAVLGLNAGHPSCVIRAHHGLHTRGGDVVSDEPTRAVLVEMNPHGKKRVPVPQPLQRGCDLGFVQRASDARDHHHVEREHQDRSLGPDLAFET